MAKLNWDKWPELKQYLLEYGHGEVDRMFEIKAAYGVEAPGIMVAIAWPEAEGFVDYCTAEFYDDEWHIVNDGHEPIKEKQWKKAYIPTDCNWVEFRD